MKILGFGASNSKDSINNRLIRYIFSKLDCESQVINIVDYEMPIYSIDREIQEGVPRNAQRFLNKIAEYDLVVISHAEHNGNYTAFYKNLLDWCSRISTDIFQGKKLIFLATSPGALGGKNVLEIAKKSAQIFNGDLCFSMSIPFFHSNFVNNDLIDEDIKKKLFSNIEKLGVKVIDI